MDTNNTLRVVSLFNCHDLGAGFYEPLRDATVRQTVVICQLLLILQEMYGFNVTYDYEPFRILEHDIDEEIVLKKLRNGTLDLYTRSVSLRPTLLDYAEPVQEIYVWSVGFTLRRYDFGLFESFFSDPFDMTVWILLLFITILAAIIFFLVKYSEMRFVRRNIQEEYSFSHEIMVAVSSLCQNSVPVNPVLFSRRTAYVTYFMFTYLIYCFYTSNLLYHLVHVRTKEMTVKDLADSHYKCVILNNSGINGLFYEKLDDESDYEYIRKRKFQTLNFVNIRTALEELKTGETAVLSDYLTLYPTIKRRFEENVICELVEVDLLSELRKYMWVSKMCKLKEEIKIGILRTKETGILRQITKIRKPIRPSCIRTGHVRAYFLHVMTPLTTLIFACVVSLLILICERIYFYRHLPLPYIE